jgi:HEAT repeat protein
MSKPMCFLLRSLFFSFAVFSTCAGMFAQEGALTRLVCGKVEGASYDRRVRAVQAIGKTLAADDFFALQAFLEKRPAEDAAGEAQLNAIKNDVAMKLLECTHLPDGFSRRFLAMVSVPELGLMWQNYTIQFLDVLWRRERDEGVRREIVAELIERTRDERLTISGTALLTLSRIAGGAEKRGVFSHKRLGELAMGMVKSEKIPWQDKITALHVAADAGDAGALGRARVWAGDMSVPVMLRMASLAVLGKLGGENDRALLEEYAKSGEFRLRVAARAALKKLTARGVK